MDTKKRRTSIRKIALYELSERERLEINIEHDLAMTSTYASDADILIEKASTTSGYVSRATGLSMSNILSNLIIKKSDFELKSLPSKSKIVSDPSDAGMISGTVDYENIVLNEEDLGLAPKKEQDDYISLIEQIQALRQELMAHDRRAATAEGLAEYFREMNKLISERNYEFSIEIQNLQKALEAHDQRAATAEGLAENLRELNDSLSRKNNELLAVIDELKGYFSKFSIPERAFRFFLTLLVISIFLTIGQLVFGEIVIRSPFSEIMILISAVFLFFPKKLKDLRN